MKINLIFFYEQFFFELLDNFFVQLLFTFDNFTMKVF
jgi:hypothetical protein